MITAQQNNASNGASFDGNIVVFENRAFSLDQISVNGTTIYQASGETVVEGVFGYSKNVVASPGYSFGYGSGADQTVLIRWNGSVQADPRREGRRLHRRRDLRAESGTRWLRRGS